MVSRIDIGPDGGPYVEIDEDAGDLVIRVPNNTVDFDSNDLLNAVLQNATMDGGSLDGVSLASALDADTQEIQNANLQNATLSDALDANNQDLNSVGTASVTALEAEELQSNQAIHPGFTQRFGSQSQTTTARWYPDNGAPQFSEFRDITDIIPNRGEGCATRDGDVWIGEDTGDGTGSTIYQIDGGTADVVDSFTFDDSEARHTNSMQWYDGLLWVGDAALETDTTYIVDWDAKAVVDTIDHDGRVDENNWRAFVPATDGEMHILFTAFFDNEGAYLVNADEARDTGSADAAIVRELSQGFEGQIQAGNWANGYMYWASHNGIAKVKTPFADEMRKGYPVANGMGLQWIAPKVVSSDGGPESLEQISYSPVRNKLYLMDDEKLYVGEEGVGNSVPEEFVEAGNEVVNDGFRCGRGIKMKETADPDSIRFRVTDEDSPMRLTAWMYDDLSDSKDSTLATNPGGSTVTLGVNTNEVTADNYARFTDTSGWEDTGVARPDTERWVGFSFYLPGSGAELRISKDGGTTWDDAGSVADGGPVDRLRLFGREGETTWTNFEFEFINSG